MSIRARIALLTILVAAVTILAFSLFVYALASHSSAAQQDRELARRSHEATLELERSGPEAVAAWRVPAPVDLSISADTFVELLDSTGAPIASTGVVVGAAPSVPGRLLRSSAGNGSSTGFAPQSGNVTLRLYVQNTPRLGGYVVARQALRPAQNQLAGLRGFLFLSAVVMLGCALGASWWVAGRALRPLKAMARMADDIGQTRDMARRLPNRRATDEIGRLSRSFNDMLERLQQAYNQVATALSAQQRFVADASHELRTPLTSIRNNAGLLLRRPDVEEEDRQAALRDIGEESERMSRLVDDLLSLARADAGQRLEAADVDLASMVERVCEQARRLHPSRCIILVMLTPTAVRGNADALARLLWILLDNAVKFTADGGHLWIRLTHAGAEAELTVADDGTGIPPDTLDRIFERFYRADPARASQGSGLGLSIAQWIVCEHEGAIAAFNNDEGGATLRVRLPLVA